MDRRGRDPLRALRRGGCQACRGGRRRMARRGHRSWGNAIAADEALDGMGADVMRWGYCEQNPGQNLRFGHGPAKEIRRRMLTLWNSVGFLVTYAEIEGFKPSYEDLAEPFAEDL